MKFDIITQQGYSQKPNIFGNVVPLFILGEIDGFNPEKLDKMKENVIKQYIEVNLEIIGMIKIIIFKF